MADLNGERVPGGKPGTAPTMAAQITSSPGDMSGWIPAQTSPGVGPAGADSADPGFPVVDANGAEMAGTIAALANDDLGTAERRKALSRLAGAFRSRGVADLFKPKAAIRWIADTIGDIAPQMPIRDLAALRASFPSMSDAQIADRLVRNAAMATAAIGAAGGGVAAVEWVATPSLLSAPVLLAAETVAVVTVEIKLIGELHEVYGVPITGPIAARGAKLIHSWAQRRGVNPLLPGVGMAAILGTAGRRELQGRLLKRFGRNLTSYGPMLTGAAVASYLNRRATIALGKHIRDDLAANHRRVIEAE